MHRSSLGSQIQSLSMKSRSNYILVSIINLFCVILIDRASLVSATRSRTLEPMFMDPNPLVSALFHVRNSTWFEETPHLVSDIVFKDSLDL
jgi:hypothetical protein